MSNETPEVPVESQVPPDLPPELRYDISLLNGMSLCFQVIDNGLYPGSEAPGVAAAKHWLSQQIKYFDNKIRQHPDFDKIPQAPAAVIHD